MDGTETVQRERATAPTSGCPRCGTRPALRVEEWVVRRLEGEPPGRRVGSYKCQRRNCGMIYDITTGALLGAIPG